MGNIPDFHLKTEQPESITQTKDQVLGNKGKDTQYFRFQTEEDQFTQTAQKQYSELFNEQIDQYKQQCFEATKESQLFSKRYTPRDIKQITNRSITKHSINNNSSKNIKDINNGINNQINDKNNLEGMKDEIISHILQKYGNVQKSTNNNSNLINMNMINNNNGNDMSIDNQNLNEESYSKPDVSAILEKYTDRNQEQNISNYQDNSYQQDIVQMEIFYPKKEDQNNQQQNKINDDFFHRLQDQLQQQNNEQSQQKDLYNNLNLSKDHPNLKYILNL